MTRVMPKTIQCLIFAFRAANAVLDPDRAQPSWRPWPQERPLLKLPNDMSAITFTMILMSHQTRVVKRRASARCTHKGYLLASFDPAQQKTDSTMTFRKWNFVFIFLNYFIVSSSFAKNNPQSAVSNSATYTSDKPRQPMDQTFNINNWGFGSADRKILTQMKYKIDSLYAKSTATGNSLTLTFSKTICGLHIKRVADITRLN